MFDKWKALVAMLVVGALAGWGAWNATSRPSAPASTAVTAAPQPDSTPGETASATLNSTTPKSTPNGAVSGTPGGTADVMSLDPVNPGVALLIGKPAPPLSIADPKLWVNTSRPLEISSYKGRVVLLEFFRINCSHCNSAAPFMNALNRQFSPQGLFIMGVQSPIQSNPAENDWAGVQRVVTTLWGATYPIAFDAQSKTMQRYYGGKRDDMRWPTTLLIDRKGVVVYGSTGHTPAKEAALYKAIQQELAKK